MSNEELAVQAKAGDRDALAQLWEQNMGLLTMLFRELSQKAGARMAAMGVTWEDVEQSYFLAIALAVELYEPERGTLFVSFLSYPVKTVFYDLVGWRTEGQKRDPLGCCLSLDDPVTGEDGSETPRSELEADPTVQYADAEERLYTEQLHATLDRCLDTMEQEQAAAIRYRYYGGLTLAEIGEKLGCNTEYARQLTSKGFRKLRSGKNIQRLKQYREQIISEGAYHGTGWNAWKNGGSVEERTVMKLDCKGLLS